ncbi:hypothetical protein F3J34_39525 [Klebsiella sp. Ap-873]|uniref:Serine/threonine specific protein phosphatases domain-containing protein n=1 Tax=Cedecea neteri TaxID=158822 RepID=A0AAN0S1Y8_9ENTR|nr:metallophosphoesterase [Cedecea neteri]AIR60066.1 hypothetical protein LH23_05145 [Cedecea neteri]NIG79652.1 hypothetical protein [Klebsiella sp. Ap-873]
MIISLKENKVGRDFVVGDLHGCFEAFKALLHNVDFNEHHDRVIAVGDLIDRGKNSQLCLELLRYEWFYSVRGNHEGLMQEWALTASEQRHDIEQRWREDGGEWFFSLPPEQQSRCVRLIEQLPMVVIVESGGYKYAILHAEIPPEVDDFIEFINRMTQVDRQAISSCLWGRRRKLARSTAVVGGIDYILAGHSPSHFPKIRYGNLLILDFGAGAEGYGCSLGLMELATQRLYLHRQGEIISHEGSIFL